MCGCFQTILQFGANRMVIETMKHSLKPISEANEEATQKIKRKSKFIHTFTITYMTCILIVSIPWHDASEDFHFILMYINQHYGKVAILRITYYLALMHTCCAMASVHLYWVYYIFHIHFQLCMLQENIQGLMEKNDLFYDDAYQRTVHEELKECIQHHQAIKRYVLTKHRVPKNFEKNKIFSSSLLKWIIFS